MQTRKHFIAAASEIAKIRALSTRKTEAEKFASVFAKSNPRFNRSRFLSACGL